MMLSRAKLVGKTAFFGGLHLLGIDRISPHYATDQPVIFFGHRIFDLSIKSPVGDFFGGIPAQLFALDKFVQRLRWLQRQYSFVSMDDALVMSETKKTGQIAVLTFDDGYSDWSNTIQPVLEEFRIPALYYVSTDALEQTRLFWFDRVYSSFMEAEPQALSIAGLEQDLTLVANNHSRRKVATEICAQLWALPPAQRDRIIEEIESVLGVGTLSASTQYLSEEELIDLAGRPGVTIGSHTLSHPNLTQLSDKELEKELSCSMHILSELIGYKVQHLSYPNGMADDRVRRMAQKSGYRSATMTAHGRPADLYGLPRINIGWWSEAEFCVRTSSAWTVLDQSMPRRRRRRD